MPEDAGPRQGCPHTTNPWGMPEPLLQTNGAARLNTGLLRAPRELQLPRDVRNFGNNSQQMLSPEFSSSLLNPINHPSCRILPSHSPLGCHSRGVAGSYLQINQEFHTIPEKPEKTCFTGETFFFFSKFWVDTGVSNPALR